MTGLRDAVVVVTGASRGIGAEVARAVAERGARVGLVSRTRADLDRLRDELDGHHAVTAVDVSDRDAVIAALGELEATLGPVEVIVNNAGIGAYGAVVETGPEVFDETIRVNYLGACVWPTQAVLPGMLRRRHGHVVNVASIAGRIGAPFEAAYSASKFAMVGFSESLAVEAAPFGVVVSLVDPGVVDTEFFERRGRPYDRSFPKKIPPARVAAAVIAAVEHGRAGERFVPGSLRWAYAVKTLVPALARSGTARTFRSELDALVERVDGGA